MRISDWSSDVCSSDLVEEQKACFAAVTENGARVMHLGGYGLKAGCHADMVILQARDVLDALRLKPARLCVIRRGQVIAETPPVQDRTSVVSGTSVSVRVDLGGRRLLKKKIHQQNTTQPLI